MLPHAILWFSLAHILHFTFCRRTRSAVLRYFGELHRQGAPLSSQLILCKSALPPMDLESHANVTSWYRRFKMQPMSCSRNRSSDACLASLRRWWTSCKKPRLIPQPKRQCALTASTKDLEVGTAVQEFPSASRPKASEIIARRRVKRVLHTARRRVRRVGRAPFPRAQIHQAKRTAPRGWDHVLVFPFDYPVD